ncbi:MAG: peptidoglycan-associated lipoprotein Pal [Alphaproteobacteria bacterium]|nr:peptidoglycan-associated lipoprotein Pal [Alphaproteobacteria bacterium]MBV9420260.1 peptidoglycan-associated lipoprotein Pal [Alphaproteobacteria bacterium]
MTKISGLLVATALAMTLAACSTPKPAPSEAPPVAPPVTTGGGTISSIVPGSAEDLRVNVGDTVHFGYNEYSINEDDRATLQRQATWLNKYPAIRVTVEGDCDERGTREYNLALGARRANAVKEYLVSLGVSAGRIETISYGKEHPVCTESTEDCWAQNRRGVTSISGGANS